MVVFRSGSYWEAMKLCHVERGNQLPAIIHTKPAVSGRLHSVRDGSRRHERYGRACRQHC
jgi:hypothetical protein